MSRKLEDNCPAEPVWGQDVLTAMKNAWRFSHPEYRQIAWKAYAHYSALLGYPAPAEEPSNSNWVGPDCEGSLARGERPKPAWKESGFSGDEYFIFERPAGFRWDVSVNRYGAPTARLFALSLNGGGPQVLMASLDLPESGPDVDLRAAAKAWADGVIESGAAERALFFGPSEERIEKMHGLVGEVIEMGEASHFFGLLPDEMLTRLRVAHATLYTERDEPESESEVDDTEGS